MRIFPLNLKPLRLRVFLDNYWTEKIYVLENILVKTYNLFRKKVARPIGEVDILVEDSSQGRWISGLSLLYNNKKLKLFPIFESFFYNLMLLLTLIHWYIGKIKLNCIVDFTNLVYLTILIISHRDSVANFHWSSVSQLLTIKNN